MCAAHMNQCFLRHAFYFRGLCAHHELKVLRAGCSGGKYTALRQNRQVVIQSRIRMEQSVYAPSLKNVQLDFVHVLFIILNDRCRIYLFIVIKMKHISFCVNSKMLNKFSIFTSKTANRLFLYNLTFFLSATLFPFVL